MAPDLRLGLTDVLRQLPPNVVDANVWQRIDNVPAFKLASRGALAVVHATKARVQLRPAEWGGGSPHEVQLVAAALEQYRDVETLVVECDHERHEAEQHATMRVRHHLLEVLRLASPFLGRRVRCFLDKASWDLGGAQGRDFVANLANCLPGLRTVELRLAAGTGSLAALAALRHLTACTVQFGSASREAFQQELCATAALSAALESLGITGRMAWQDKTGQVAPPGGHVELPELHALTQLRDVTLDLSQGPGMHVPVAVALDGLPPSVRSLRLATLDGAACRAMARLPRLQRLEAEFVRLPADLAGVQLPAALEELRLPQVRPEDLPSLVHVAAGLVIAHVEVCVRCMWSGNSGRDDVRLQMSSLRGLAHVRSLHLEFHHLMPFNFRSLLEARALPCLARPLRHLTLALRFHHLGGDVEDYLGEDLAPCFSGALEELHIDASVVTPQLVRRVLRGRTLRHALLRTKLLQPPPAEGAAGLLGACLAARAAAGLAPLRLSTSLLTLDEAARLQAELRSAGHGHYIVTS